MIERKYWWVMQGKNFESEKEGGYIFAPDDDQFSHKSLKELKIGDLIIHYALKGIKAISLVQKEYVVGVNSKGEKGLLVNVNYNILDNPIGIDKIAEIFSRNNNASKLPEKYSPLTRLLTANSNGYLYNFTFEAYFCLFCQSNLKNKNQPNNTIYFGPPGTGKTYNLFSKAVELIDPYFPRTQKTEIIRRYDELRNMGFIEFSTFHQSLSYEEFIEGLRYDVNRKIPVVKDGLLKKLSVISSYLALDNSRNIVKSELNFENVYDYIVETCKEEQYVFMAKSGIEQKLVYTTSEGNLKIQSPSALKSYIVSKKRLMRLYSYVIEKNIDVEYESINFVRDAIGGANATAYWSVLKWIMDRLKESQGIEEDDDKTIDNDIDTYKLAKVDEEVYEHIKRRVLEELNHKENFNFNKTNNVVLILDEINRGNISKIFGELISLIEDDKRLGMPNYINITLPYSQESFTLPSNLYILGTMNTSDRSIALMDVALRRRFSFKEVMPDAEIIKENLMSKNGLGHNYVEFIIAVFKNLNKRIEVLVDKNYQIGHSYFLKIKKESDLIGVWNQEIIPLVQEYFFNDWEKLELLLGSDKSDYSFIINKNELTEYQDLFFSNGEDLDYPKEIKIIDDLEDLLKTLKYVFKINED
ncbi:AAA family ATPase [Peribacillus frigoritolerans]|uniref:McrB family protein n=1 Tax=Peribacillus frigoritolerans TaxID=450367 RepID=UPI002B2549AB|nr:AAA family ATPase [Peribacillus frigoritolerans]MEB2492876.1 AAA family ATPase [Peribacillus frigoritolerans]